MIQLKIKINTRPLLQCSFLALLFLLSSCKKNVAGPKGESGKAIANGNTKQYKTQTITIEPNMWKNEIKAKDWDFKIYNEAITQDVILNGSVEVSVKLNEEWQVLPYSNLDNFLQVFISIGFVHLYNYKVHGFTPKPQSMTIKIAIFTKAN
jgi:hypothetical protein